MIRKWLTIMLFGITITISGCSKKGSGQNLVVDLSKTGNFAETDITEDSKKLAECYRDIYGDAKTEKGTFEEMAQLIQCLGEAGFVAVDAENQIDLTHPEQVENFCQKVKTSKSSLTIYVVMQEEGGIRYHFTASDGKVDVVQSKIEWDGNYIREDYIQEYPAYTLVYTTTGYLFFEQYHMPGYDGPSGHTAIRVQPLDSYCRELNRKYVLPIGYSRNQLLITDWSEDDFSGIDFYDFYDLMYFMKNGCYVPYIEDYMGTEYQIPRKDFESVIQTYFQIDSKVLEEACVYDQEQKTYRYRPRTLYDSESPWEPFPEVLDSKKNSDGTLTLIVSGVLADENLDRAIMSELVIRIKEDGGWQYVSNHVIDSDGQAKAKWYTPRLTDEEWKKYYGEGK